MQDTLKRSKKDQSAKVLPADKGRATVVWDADTYQTKMSSLIENGPYQLLNIETRERLSRKLSEKLLRRSGYLSGAVYNKITPPHNQPPAITCIKRRISVFNSFVLIP